MAGKGRDLEGKVYIVTGSSSGIGAATARQLAERGARVAVNYRGSEAAALEVAQRCRDAGGEVIVVQADVSKDADCRSLAKATTDKWGRLDGLVNNAGTTKFVSHANLDGLDAEDFQKIYGVNVVGPYQMIRACAPALRASQAGAVVNVSSIAGSQAHGSSIAYAASKGALNTMTMALARALGPSIRVNAVLPGFVETSWLKEGLGKAYEAVRENWHQNTPLEATLTPDDVADAILFLLTTPKVTGQLLTVDSGRALGKGAGMPGARG